MRVEGDGVDTGEGGVFDEGESCESWKADDGNVGVFLVDFVDDILGGFDDDVVEVLVSDKASP